MRPYGEPLPELPQPSSWTAPFKVTPPANDLDPVTYEIVRHRLWFAGMTIGETLKKVSGTIVVSEAQDFSTYITLPDAAPVFLGPYVMLHAGIANLIIDNTVRLLEEAEGVRAGDMYFVNDPWMGVAHQPDCAVVSPYFVAGELVAWCGVTLHQLDMGGVDPGGVSPHARDAFGEPTIYPAVRIVERGRMRADIDRLLRRNSRLPDILALDIRSMIAANRAVQADLDAIVARYGVDVVRDVMAKMLWDSYDAFGERLKELPRGTFRSRDFFEMGGYAPEQADEVFEVDLALTNDGDRLVFDFSGTSPQASGFVNCGYGGMMGGVLATVLPQIAYDIPWNGGITARIEVVSQVGTVNNPTWPAAVSGGITEGAISTGTVSAAAIGNMILGQPEIRRHMTTGAGSIFLGSTIGGMNDDGSLWGTLLMDPIGMGGSATAVGDGIDLCGSGAIPYTQFANVESAEQHYPILYLFRRLGRDAFGLGRYRGGRALEFAFKVHGTPVAAVLLWSHGVEFPNVGGLCGSGTSSAARFLLARDAGVAARFARGELPGEPADFDFEAQLGKTELLIGPDDVMMFGVPGGTGFGDPLERDLGAVALDVAGGALDRGTAVAYFGAVIDDAGRPNRDASAALRARKRDERLLGAQVPVNETSTLAGVAVVEVGEGFTVHLDGPDFVWACGRCGRGLGPAAENPRSWAACREVPINENGHPMGQLVRRDEQRFVLREFLCPSCALRLATEVVRPGVDPPIFAVEFDPGWLREQSRANA